MNTPYDHLKPPFSHNGRQLIDSTNDVVADNIKDEHLAKLITGLLNGHFHVPVILEGRPIQLGIRGKA